MPSIVTGTDKGSFTRRLRHLGGPLAVYLAVCSTLLGSPAGAVTESSGCNTGPTSPPDDTRLTINVGGTDRTYNPYTPNGYSRSTAYPLVFAFHGTGDQATVDYTSNPPINVETWGELFCSSYYGHWAAEINGGSDPGIVVCPDALKISGGPYNGYYTWVHATDDEFFDALLAQMLSTYCVDLDRIFVAGHSIGGFFANEVACERGDIVRGMASISGGGPFESESNDTAEGDCEGGKTGKVAALVMHGSSDGTVPPSSGVASRDYWRTDNGCSGGAAIPISGACARNGSDTHEAYAGCSSTEGYRVEWCLWQGVNHTGMFDVTCSPLDPNYPPGCSSDDNLAPPATWEFFQSLAPISTLEELFSDGFESAFAPWDGTAGDPQTTNSDPAEGSLAFDVDFADLDGICSAADEATVDTNGLPYQAGGTTACLRVLVEDTAIADTATFTAGLLVEIGNGLSVADGVPLTLENDASLVAFTYVQDDLAAALAGYHASFELNVENLDLPNGVDLDLVQGFAASGELLFRVVLTHTGSEDRLFLVASEDGGGSDTTAESSDLGNGWNTIEIAFSEGTGDGFFSLSIEGVAQDSSTGLDNDSSPLALVRLGYAGGARNGTGGNLWLDDFQSWTDTE